MSKTLTLDTLYQTAIEGLFAHADQARPLEEKQAAAVRQALVREGTDDRLLDALVTLYAVRKEKGTLDGLRIALLGNLKSDEVAHDLARMLGRFEVRLSFVSPAALSMPYEVSDELRAAGLEVEETNDLATTLRKADVLYLVRLDPATIEPKVYARFKDWYNVSPSLLQTAKPGLLVLGSWDGAEELLAPARARRPGCEGALLAALRET